MIKHIILWKLDGKLTQSEKMSVKENAKYELENLVGKVPGLITMQIQIDHLPSSNVDMMLYSELEDENALNVYKDHPEHVRVADNFVRPYIAERSCIDFMA